VSPPHRIIFANGNSGLQKSMTNTGATEVVTNDDSYGKQMLIPPIEHSAEDCICIDCDPNYSQLQRTLHWISMAEFYAQDPHQVLRERFFPSQTVVVRTPQEFFHDYVHASTVDYYREWISNCTGMYWMFR